MGAGLDRGEGGSLTVVASKGLDKAGLYDSSEQKITSCDEVAVIRKITITSVIQQSERK